MQEKKQLFNCIETISGNGTFALYEQVLHFLQYLQVPSAWTTIEGASVDGRVKPHQRCMTDSYFMMLCSTPKYFCTRPLS